MMFQFTHPVRGATSSTDFVFNRMYVSIHAPRAGCDLKCNRQVTPLYVSIHAPRAGCDIVQITIVKDKQVSIHAPRAGCDV